MSVSPDIDAVGKALLSEKRRSDGESQRRWWSLCGGSVVLYVFGQLAHSGRRIVEGLMQGARDSGRQLSDLELDLSMGISAEVSSTLVLGIAAFVVTINVAVFAARISSPQDEASMLDLARWQHRMQGLAPLACALALAITYTQIPSDITLGLSLLFVSSLAAVASDIRIAGRLTALRMEVRAAEKFSDYSDGQLQNLQQALPENFQSRLKGVRVGEYRGTFLALIPVLIFVSLGACSVALIWYGDPALYPSDIITVDLSDALQLLFLIWFLMTITTGPAMLAMNFAAAGAIVRAAGLTPPVSGIGSVGTKARWMQWALLLIAVACLASVPLSLSASMRTTLFTGLIIVFCFWCNLLVSRVAVRTGRGLGIAPLWLAIENRAMDSKLAQRRFEQANVAHEQALERQEALAESARVEAAKIEVITPTGFARLTAFLKPALHVALQKNDTVLRRASARNRS